RRGADRKPRGPHEFGRLRREARPGGAGARSGIFDPCPQRGLTMRPRTIPRTDPKEGRSPATPERSARGSSIGTARKGCGRRDAAMSLGSVLSRRSLLRGLGGVSVALPFLEAFAPRSAQAQVVNKRFVVFF